jgi:hypothetical protein
MEANPSTNNGSVQPAPQGDMRGDDSDDSSKSPEWFQKEFYLQAKELGDSRAERRKALQNYSDASARMDCLEACVDLIAFQAHCGSLPRTSAQAVEFSFFQLSPSEAMFKHLSKDDRKTLIQNLPGELGKAYPNS